MCVCAHLFALLHDLSNVSFYNLSHAFIWQPLKTKHVLPIENKSKGVGYQVKYLIDSIFGNLTDFNKHTYKKEGKA